MNNEGIILDIENNCGKDVLQNISSNTATAKDVLQNAVGVVELFEKFSILKQIPISGTREIQDIVDIFGIINCSEKDVLAEIERLKEKGLLFEPRAGMIARL